MEASQAGLGGDAGQGQGEAQGEAQGQGQQGPDLSALAEQLPQLSQNMEAMRSFLESEPWKQPAPEAEPQQEETLNLDWLDTGDPEYNQQLAQNLQALIQNGSQQEIQRALQNELAPVREQLEDLRTQYQAERLVEEFPELNEEETANRVIQMSRQRAEALGQPDLAKNPDFWRETYLLGRAMQAMQEEQQAGQEPVAHLEGGGGAGAGQVSQVDLGDQIVNGASGNRLGSRVLPFQ